MLAFGCLAISSFSGQPLRLALGVGAAMRCASILYAIYAVCMMTAGSVVPGWTSLVCLQVGLSGITLLVIGLMGDYVARIYDEIKGRPLYIVRDLHNMPADRLSLGPLTSAVVPPPHMITAVLTV